MLNATKEKCKDFFEAHGEKSSRDTFEGELNCEAGKLFFITVITIVAWLPYIPNDLKLHQFPMFAVSIRIGLSLLSICLIALKFTPKFRNRPNIMLAMLIGYLFIGTSLITATAGKSVSTYTGGFCFILMLSTFTPFHLRLKVLGNIFSFLLFFAVGAFVGLNFSEDSIQYSINDLFFAFLASTLIAFIINNIKYKSWNRRQKLNHVNNNLQEMIDTKTKAVVELQNTMLKTIAELVEYRDDITGGHIGRTQGYLEILIHSMQQNGLYKDEISSWNINLVLQSAQLHDVGKIAIKDNILLKPDKLSYEEFSQIKEHTIFGEKIIAKIEKSTTERAFLNYAKIFAGSHHEKWDGSGYPKGLKGEEIPLLGRIMAIVDVYDALTHERPYKKAFSHERAIEIITEGRGTHFDPLLVDLFISIEGVLTKV